MKKGKHFSAPCRRVGEKKFERLRIYRQSIWHLKPQFFHFAMEFLCVLKADTFAPKKSLVRLRQGDAQETIAAVALDPKIGRKENAFPFSRIIHDRSQFFHAHAGRLAQDAPRHEPKFVLPSGATRPAPPRACIT